jgi:hypothetical protein
MEVFAGYTCNENDLLPWAEAGFKCWAADIRNEDRDVPYPSGGIIHYRRIDMTKDLPPCKNPVFAIMHPPCTHGAVSGARWFRDKGLDGLSDYIRHCEIADRWLQWFGCPGYFEQPMVTLSTYWRKPDYKFHPWEYTTFCEDDNFTKESWIWGYNGFVMPKPLPLHGMPPPDNRIHMASPSPERAHFRSITPLGWARAVFEANRPA